MPTPGAHEIITHRRGRPYAQFGGPRPNNKPYFYGGETGYFTITGVENPVRGGVDPIYVHNPNQVGTYSLTTRTITPPDLPTASMTFRERVGSIPRHLLGQGCLINAYLVRGNCKDLSTFDTGWEDYVEVYSAGLITDRSMGDRFDFEADDPVETELGVTWENIYPVGAVAFSERIASTIAREITAVCYADKQLCGECGPANDGTQWMYAAELGGAPGDPNVYYSTDGGSNWTASAVTPSTQNAENITCLAVMGNYLVAISVNGQAATQGAMYYATINNITGAPGSWTQITSGFTAGQEPRAIYVAGPREAYVACDGGVILKITDVPSGVTSLGAVSASDLLAISGDGDTIVAVGTSAAVVRSVNRGQSWSATTTSPGAASLNAVAVLDRNRYWVGNASGVAYYTLTGGEAAWTTVSLGLPTAATAIQDIKFATQEVGYIAYTISGTLGRVAATINGGYTWISSESTQPRLLGVPTTATQRYNRIAVPRSTDAGVNANNVIIGGLGATTDGALMVGASNPF
jgi:hypothetical protein